MELHYSAKAKQLWNLLRVAIFMIRKGLLSKRKLVGMQMNLMMKRRILHLGENLFKNHHHHHSKTKQPPHDSPIPYGFQEFEFSSCYNSPSPNPIFFHLNGKRRRSYFPCISLTAADDEDENDKSPERAVALPQLPLSVRVSNYSLEEEVDGGLSQEVDCRAEEFIKRFYEQIQAQTGGASGHEEEERKRSP